MNKNTKNKIQMSFLQLLEEKEFTKVSVRDITIAAKINRGTFYLHYQDKYDLINQMEESILSGLETYLENLKPDAVLNKVKQGKVSVQAVEVFRYIQMNVHIFKVFLSRNNLPGFHKRFKQFFMKHFIENTIEGGTIFKDVTIPKDYLSSFAASAFLGMVEQWLENDLAESPVEMAEMYIQIITLIRKL